MTIHVGIGLLTLILAIPSAPAQPSDAPDSCGEALRSLERSASTSYLNGIKKRYTLLPKEVKQTYSTVDAQRLINSADWVEAKSRLSQNPDLLYTERTLQAWKDARAFVDQNIHADLNPELLQNIHRHAMNGLPFHGYEGRRLRLKFERGEMTEETFKSELKRAYQSDSNPSGTDHATLKGKFRSDPIDDILHSGSSSSPNVGRYFTRDELDAARKNPYMRVDESSIMQIDPNGFRAKSYYTHPEEVKKRVEQVFLQLNEDLKRAQEPDVVIHAVAKMQKGLLAIHPFLDGNGRTIRLLSDLIYQRHGLPPSVLLREEELTLSVNELASDIKQGMRIYLDQKELDGDRRLGAK